MRENSDNRVEIIWKINYGTRSKFLSTRLRHIEVFINRASNFKDRINTVYILFPSRQSSTRGS